jgi:hypothetical protein
MLMPLAFSVEGASPCCVKVLKSNSTPARPRGRWWGWQTKLCITCPALSGNRTGATWNIPPRPGQRYERLLCDLVQPRQHLRQYLQTLGNYTLIPGSTLALGDSTIFLRSDPGNPYHTYIQKTYGTRVVTASVHINIGIDDPETLIRACRLVRVEAPLYLALSAASPWLDGRITGWHSTRWHQFPLTPPPCAPVSQPPAFYPVDGNPTPGGHHAKRAPFVE